MGGVWNWYLTNHVTNGVSCARYKSLIFQDVYEKEGIFVPSNVPKEKFTIYQHPKTVEDDSEIFLSATRILDSMLRKVDPRNHVLVDYLSTINPNCAKKGFVS